MGRRSLADYFGFARHSRRAPLSLQRLEARLLLAAWSGDIPDSTVWPTGQVQTIVGDCRVPAGSTLTIQPGAIVQLRDGFGDDLVIDGTLNAVGTSGQPILITSVDDDTGFDGIYGTGDDIDTGGDGESYGGNGDWGYIVFTASSTGSVMDYVDVRYGGWGRAAQVEVNGGELTLTNSVLRNSSQAGLRVANSAPTVTGNTFRDNAKAAVSMDLASNPAITGVTLVNNATNGLSVDAGTLAGDSWWDDPDIVYCPSGDVTVPLGSTLTVGAGQVVKMRVGFSDDIFVDGTLAADGTESEPIVFTSLYDDTAGGDTNNNGSANGPSNGNWDAVHLRSTSTGSVMDYVEVRYGGYGEWAALVVDGGELTLTNSTLINSSTAGLRVDNSNPVVTDNTFENNSVAAVRMDLASNPDIQGVTLTNNGVNGLILDAGTLPSNGYWDDPDIVYRSNGDVTVPEGYTLTVGAGQVVKMRVGYGDDIFIDGTLVADGTESEPIIFTSYYDDTAGGDTNNNGSANGPSNGNWDAIHLRSTSTGNVMDYVQVCYGGTGEWAELVVASGELTLTNSTLTRSSTAGLRIDASNPVIVDNTFENNTVAAVRMDLASNPDIRGVTLANNGVNGLIIDDGTLTQNAYWDDPDIVYRSNGDVTVPEGYMLTVGAGQVVKMRVGYGDDIFIDGTLVADGTESEPIVFTSWYDDTAGGDTNNNGSANGPSNGNWDAVHLRSTSTGNVMDYVQVRYGGTGEAAQIVVSDGELVLTNSESSYSSSDGLRVTGQATVAGVTFNGNTGEAISASLGAVLAISGTTAENNGLNGLALDGGTLPGDAVWDDADIVHVLYGDVTVPEGSTLTVAPGVIVKSRNWWDDELIVNGTLDARGSAGSPIIFTTDQDDDAGGDTNADGAPGGAYGDWAGITFGSTSVANVLEHVDVRYGGAWSSAALTVVNSELAVTDSSIRGSVSDGLRFTGSSVTVAVVEFNGNIGEAVSMDVASNPDISDVTFVNNGLNGLAVDGGALVSDAVWDDTDVVHVLYGDVTVPEGSTLTLAPGLIVKARTSWDDALIVNGTLDAVGTGASPIVFTTDLDDTAGGDTNNDGAPGSYGDWQGIVFGSTSTGSVLHHVEVRYGGAWTSGAVVVDGADLAVRNSILRNASSHGLVGANGACLELVSSLVIGNAGAGVRMETGSSLTAFNDTIDDNQRGLYLADAEVDLLNSLVTNNVVAGVQATAESDVNVHFSDVYNPGASNYSGLADPTGTDGNISEDPLYADAGSLDYGLQAGSPAVDAGRRDGAPATDFYGYLRFDDPDAPNRNGDLLEYFDMGAIEFGGFPPSDIDLEVSNVIGPATGEQGGTVHVSWTVHNLGLDDAPDAWYDGIYLSPDATWSSGDRLLGSLKHTGGLAAGEHYDVSTDVEVGGVVPGEYYLVVVSDVRYETWEGATRANNEAPSAATVEFTMTELSLGVPLDATFSASREGHYYAVEVAAGTNLDVRLDDADGLGLNELQVSFGQPPDSDTIGAAYTATGAADLEVFVPSASPGTWYVLAYCAYTTGSSDYSVTAEASSIDLTGIAPARLGNGAPMTLTLTGAGFTSGADVELVAEDATVYTATSVEVDAFTQLTAFFGAGAVPPGLYDVRVVQPSLGSTILPDSFEVVAGGSADIEARVIVPSVLGYHQVATIYVECTNTGDLAMASPLVVVTAEQEGEQRALMTLDGSLLTKGFWTSAIPDGFSNSVMFMAGDDTPGIFQPGETVRVPVYWAGWQQPWDFSYPPFEFNIGVVTTDNDEPIDWVSLEDQVRPPTIGEGAWEILWDNFVGGVGSTVGDYVSMLDGNAFQLGLLGHDVRDVVDLLEFELNQANGLNPVDTLSVAVDAAGAAPGMPLAFWRSFPSSIPARHKLGPLGWGWSHGWELSLIEAEDGTVHVVTAGSTHRVFQPDTRGGYFSEAGDRGVLSAEGGGAFSLSESTGEVWGFRADGKLDYFEDANGNRISCGYTGDLLTALTQSGGQALAIHYNEDGRIDRITDPEGDDTTFTYDASGEYLVSVDQPGAGVTTYSYETAAGPAQHALVEVEYPDTSQDFFSYDAHGWLTGIEGPDGMHALTLSYGPAGKVSASTAGGDTFDYFYDHHGLLAKVVDAQGDAVHVQFDADGLLREAVDPAGRSYTLDYDEDGNLVRSTDPLGQSTTYGVASSLGRLQALTDAAGNRTDYSYDGNGNLLSISRVDGTVETFDYDGLGNMTSRTTRDGETVDYTYDADGRLVAKDYPDGSGVDYVYDGRGNLVSTTDAAGTTLLAYDAGDRLAKVTYPSGRFLDYDYDADGRLVSMTDQLGYTVGYVFDEWGRLKDVVDGGGDPIVTYTYDADGRIVREDRDNGVYATYDHDSVGHVTAVVNYAPDHAVISSFDYAYDSMGMVSSVESLDGEWTYEYDAAGRLTRAVFDSDNLQIPDQDIAYAYDAAGNRTAVVANSVSSDYEANAMNQYTEAGDTDYVYDAAGRLVQETSPAGTTTYTYDYEGRLTGVSSPEGDWTYTYDAFGNRASVTKDGVTTWYLVDPMGIGKVVGEYDAAGVLVAHYDYGYGLLATTNPAGDSSHYLYDAIGNTHQLTNPAGSVLNSYAYDPFGNALLADEAGPNPFRYIGRSGVLSEANGLVAMRARFYDPAQGRFVQEDPIDIAGGLNLYSYCANDPVNALDPSGLYSEMASYVNHLRLFITRAYMPYMTSTELRGLQVLLQSYNVGSLEWLATEVGVDVQVLRYQHLPSLYDSFVETVQFNELQRAAEQAAPEAAGGGGLAAATWAYLTQDAWVWLSTGGKAVVAAKAAFLAAWGYGWYRAGRWFSEATGLDEAVTEAWIRIDRDIFDGYIFGAANWLANLFGGSAGSRDPNCKVGPAGYGDPRFVDGEESLAYRVDFENDATATAPAQIVTITDQLGADLDWSTFELTEIGYGDRVITIGPGSQSFSKVQPMSYLGVDFDVHINAGIDLDTGEVSVSFWSIDPATGLPPSVDVGFLPPEDSTGRGMGYFSYLVDPDDGLATGTEIRNVAVITFDFGEVIATNQVDPHDPGQGTDPDKEALVTVDSLPPASSVLALAANQTAPTFDVAWSGFDDAGGSGIVGYDVYVSTDGAPYVLWLDGTTGTSGSFSGSREHGYAFYSVAVDGVGRREAVPGAADTSTYVLANDPPSIVLGDPAPGATVAPGDVYAVTWTDSDEDHDAWIDLYWDTDTDPGNNAGGDEGVAWGAIAVGVSEDDATDSYGWTVDAPPGGAYYLYATIADGEAQAFDYTATTLSVNTPPQIDLDDPAPGASVPFGDPYLIGWTDSDPDNDAQISLYWDIDTDSGNNLPGTEGTAWGTIATGLSEDDAADAYNWAMGAPAGSTYYFRAVIDDGMATDEDYTGTGVFVEHMVRGEFVHPEGTATVTIYDMSGPQDIVADDISVKFGKDNSVSSIAITGDKPMDGLALVISSATAVGKVKDARKGAPGEVAFLASDAPVKALALKSGMSGLDVNGISLGGIDFPADVDGDAFEDDPVAVYIDGWLGKAAFVGDVSGDIWVGQGDPKKGLAVAALTVKAGGYHGDMVLDGHAGKVAFEGDIASSVSIAGDLKGLTTKGGNVAGPVAVGGYAGKIAVMASKDKATGVYAGGTVTEAGSIAISGADPKKGTSLKQLATKGGGLLGDVTTVGALAKVSVMGGDITSVLDVQGALGAVSVKGMKDKATGTMVGGNVSGAEILVDDLFKALALTGDFTDSTVNAGELSKVAVKGAIGQTGGLHEIRALTGSFKIQDNTWKGVVDLENDHWFSGLHACVG